MTDDRHRYRDATPRETERTYTGPIRTVPDPETVFGRIAQEHLAELIRAALTDAPPDSVGGRSLTPTDVTAHPYVAADGGLEVHLSIGDHGYCVRITEI